MRLIDADALKASVPETSVDIFENCRNCKTLMDWEVKKLIDDAPTIDALALLKEQEAVEPKKQIEETEWIVCGHCNGHIIHKWKFCPSCGRSVKWDA